MFSILYGVIGSHRYLPSLEFQAPYIQDSNFREITGQFPLVFISFGMCWLRDSGVGLGLDKRFWSARIRWRVIGTTRVESDPLRSSTFADGPAAARYAVSRRPYSGDFNPRLLPRGALHLLLSRLRSPYSGLQLARLAIKVANSLNPRRSYEFSGCRFGPGLRC